MPRWFMPNTALALLLALAFCACLPATAHAASGTVYSCKIIPTYQHPVTGAIEDSGGASSQATGQAMVESSVAGKGMLEITDSGKFYLTIRMSLVDYTRDHEFKVQEWGSDGWNTPKMGVTATGSDSNGTTNDVCIQIPSQKCVVRVSMFVESMGRDVVFFCYAKGFEEGVPKGFKATRVTKPSDGGAAAAAKSGEDEKGADAGNTEKTEPQGEDTAASAGGTDGDAPVASDASELTGGAVSSAQGLSLSTADDVGATAASGADGAQGVDTVSGSTVTYGLVDQVLANIATVAGSGIILLLVAAGIVYFFRKNWARWGGADPDDYSEEYDDE